MILSPFAQNSGQVFPKETCPLSFFALFLLQGEPQPPVAVVVGAHHIVHILIPGGDLPGVGDQGPLLQAGRHKEGGRLRPDVQGNGLPVAQGVPTPRTISCCRSWPSSQSRNSCRSRFRMQSYLVAKQARARSRRKIRCLIPFFLLFRAPGGAVQSSYQIFLSAAAPEISAGAIFLRRQPKNFPSRYFSWPCRLWSKP